MNISNNFAVPAFNGRLTVETGNIRYFDELDREIHGRTEKDLRNICSGPTVSKEDVLPYYEPFSREDILNVDTSKIKGVTEQFLEVEGKDGKTLRLYYNKNGEPDTAKKTETCTAIAFAESGKNRSATLDFSA